MANLNHRRSTISSMFAFSILSGTKIKHSLAALVMLFATLNAFAQDQGVPSAPEPQPEPQAAAPRKADSVTVPAGTRFVLVLTNPVASKTMHRGDTVYAQTTAPIAVGDQVVIPAGTFVQGKLDKLTRNGNRGEMQLQSVAVMFPDGYVANLAGPMTIESDEGTAWQVPGGGNVAGAIAAPLAGVGIGTLIGHAAGGSGQNINGMNFNPGGLKSTAIGSMIGLAVGGVVSFIFLTHSRQFLVDSGSPMEMTLPQPLILAQDQVADAVNEAQEHPVAPMPMARHVPGSSPVDTAMSTGICYTPDTPGTPSTVIPGTPAIGDSPGTPNVVIPGTPSIPGTPYPCP